MFDNFNVNLRKNEGFLTCIPCIPIPKWGQSNAPLFTNRSTWLTKKAVIHNRSLSLIIIVIVCAVHMVLRFVRSGGYVFYCLTPDFCPAAGIFYSLHPFRDNVTFLSFATTGQPSHWCAWFENLVKYESEYYSEVDVEKRIDYGINSTVSVQENDCNKYVGIAADDLKKGAKHPADPVRKKTEIECKYNGSHHLKNSSVQTRSNAASKQDTRRRHFSAT